MATPKDRLRDIDDEPEMDLDALEAESLPLHTLQNGSLSSTANNATPKSPAQHRSTAYLDGLRGLAAFFVYYYHHLSWFYGPTAPFVWGLGHVDAETGEGGWYFVQLPWIRIFFSGGNPAVAIFFVLSGYVLSISPFRKLHDGRRKDVLNSLVSATVRRPFRLYIPVIGVSLAFVVAMHLPFGLAPKVGWPTPKDSLAAELAEWVPQTLRVLNPFALLGITKPWYIYDPPAYTMAIEYVGSMLVFALLACLTFIRSARLHGLILVLLGLAFLLTYHWTWAMFTMGMFLALNDVETFDSTFPSRFGARATNTLHHTSFIVGWYLLSQPAGPMDAGKMSMDTPGWYILTNIIPSIYIGPNKEYWRWWNAWGALLLVYSVLRIRWLQRFFTSRPLVYLGRLSFMLYLTHTPVLWTFADRVYRAWGNVPAEGMSTWWDGRFEVPNWGPHGFGTRWFLAQGVVLPVQFLVAEGATRGIDRPSIEVGRWIVGRLGLEGRK
ncbi:acyltransferase like protein [Zymoseptoria brevis]|uniref:Acyltransferase like protein n=1 Tax=Zymoseptoria brevis TaxID=1047168 RepID=A0A0F4H129_9PEZI|nr:acyltransferase like protein [Zymoseptoria brevis]